MRDLPVKLERMIHFVPAHNEKLRNRVGDMANTVDVILANPPFKGSLDSEDVHASLTGKVKTKKTELLFVALILRMLKSGGRSATIVPDGVLFGSYKAHAALRQLLVVENQLEGVFSLPSARPVIASSLIATERPTDHLGTAGSP